MFKRIIDFLGNISARFFPESKTLPEGPSPTIYEQVKQALQEWRQSRELFNSVSDPDLIDHAVYAMEASERRYIYLLKKAREGRKDNYKK